MTTCPPGHTMSAITVMVRTNMAAMAHMFLAQRVRSIHTEKATSLLGNLWDKQTNSDENRRWSCFCIKKK